MQWNRSLPNGTKDKLFKEASQSHQLESLVNQHFALRGYHRVETPLIEFEEVFSAMDQKATTRYRFFDEQGQIVVLRPDMTLPIGRVMSTTGIIPPVQLFYSGKVFRVNKDHSGEYNEQLQAGMELIGYPTLKAEAECLINAVTISQKSGLSDFQIELGHALIYQTIVEALQLSVKEKTRFKWLLQSKNMPAMALFLEKYEAHPLYDFVLKLPRLFGDAGIFEEVISLTNHPEILKAIDEMKDLIQRVQQVYPQQDLTVDIGLVPEMKYYTGITFKGYADRSSDAFFSGGRYDNLLTEFSVDAIEAVGLVFYLDRMYSIFNRQEDSLPLKIATLIYFENDCLYQAEQLISNEPQSRFSLQETLEETLEYAKQWGIPRVLIVSNEGIKEVCLASKEDESGEVKNCVNQRAD